MSNLFDLTGKVALVTGASRGLGQQLARALAGAGADLAITSRTRASLEPFAEEVRALGRRVATVEGTVTHADGRTTPLTAAELLAPLEAALKAASWGIAALAAALVVFRMTTS